MQNPASAQVHGISSNSTQTGQAGKGQAGNSFYVPTRCCCEVLQPLPKGQTPHKAGVVTGLVWTFPQQEQLSWTLSSETLMFPDVIADS